VSNTEAPTTVREDRHYICLTIPEYNNFAEAIATGCYLDRDGNHCKISKAKLKKLKNIRYTIMKSPYLLKSLIWKEQLRLIEQELRKRQRIKRGEFQ
jgi:hypothetical protein